MSILAANRIQPGDGDPRHGTFGGYANHKCRCDSCRKTANAWQRKRRAERGPLGPDDPRHGTVNGYDNYGCRCGPCRLARSEAIKRWPSRQRPAVTP